MPRLQWGTSRGSGGRPGVYASVWDIDGATAEWYFMTLQPLLLPCSDDRFGLSGVIGEDAVSDLRAIVHS